MFNFYIYYIMKFIKKYEMIIDDNHKYKDYIISFDKNPNMYFLDKLSYMDDKIIIVEELYILKNGIIDKIIKILNNSTLKKSYLENVIFTSDSLDECYSYLEMLKNSQKFNL